MVNNEFVTEDDGELVAIRKKRRNVEYIKGKSVVAMVRPASVGGMNLFRTFHGMMKTQTNHRDVIKKKFETECL